MLVILGSIAACSNENADSQSAPSTGTPTSNALVAPSSTIDENRQSVLLDVRRDILSALLVESPDLDEYCHKGGSVDVCASRGMGAVASTSETCVQLEALPGARPIEIPQFATTYKPICGAVGVVAETCFFVEVDAKNDEPNGAVLVIVADPTDWAELNAALASFDEECP